MRRIEIDTPTPEQEALCNRLDQLQIEAAALNSPINPNFLPDEEIDGRRLREALERLRDDTLVKQAVVLTMLASEPNVTIV